MRSPESKVVLVTGASKGIGLTCSIHLSRLGYTVYGTSRNAPEMQSPAQQSSASFRMIQLDVTSDESVQRGIRYILEREQRLDVVVNNAGFGYGGSVEDTSIDEARRLFETNLWGSLRICRAVLPVMRLQQSGMILNMSSLGGLIAVPFQGVYSASKFALEGLTEALRMEVKPFGIDVVLIEPGDVVTEFTANRLETRASQTNPAYREQFDKTLGIIEHDESTGIASQQVAMLMARIITTARPRRRYKVAHPIQRLSAVLNRLLPQSIMEYLVKDHYGLPRS